MSILIARFSWRWASSLHASCALCWIQAQKEPGLLAPAHIVYYLADDTYAMLLGLLLGLFGIVRLFLYNRLFLYDCLGLLL